jgi:hypothetical protein
MLSLKHSSNNEQSIATLRIMKGNSMDYFRLIYFKILYLDLRDLDSLPSTCEVTEPDLSNIFQHTVTISPDEVNIKYIEIFILF